MYNISIKHALIGVFALAFTAFAGFAYMGISGLRSLSAVTRDISSDALPAVQRSQDMALLIADLRVAYRDHVLAEDKSVLATTEKQIADLHAALDRDIDAYGPFASSDRERQLITEIKDTKQQYEAAGPGLFAFSNTRDSEGARIYLAQTMKPMVKKIQAAAAELVALNKKSGEIDTIAAEQTEARVSTLMLGIAGAVFVFFAACALYAMRGISAPLVRLTGAMKNVASGETGITVPFADRRNEVGQMARALEIFREAAITNRRLEAEAAAARKQMEADRIAAQERAEADAAARLRVATSGLAGGLQRLASGDLAFQLDDAFAPDFEQLRHDFNASVQQLGETLVAVAASIGSLQNGTQEIAAGANDLSRRTEQQAASLEETAAALDQITVNVRNSTERTGEARAVAGHATTAADRSAEVVGQAESAMRRIEESSQQISNIIGVIDEIAFQTNLLALNAGVEAARAGEAGKGFAVVAQEVRELAQRAASAAKEIKGLISTSTTEVNTGVRLVRDAGDALKTIGHYITEMNAHMQAIATSAQEQSTGLAEVNIAVNQMDQTTQQNAAMVEQSTAAASSLASEAEKLKDMVNRFRLANARRAPAPVHRQPVSAAPVSPSRATPAFATAGATALAVNSWEEF